VDGRVTRPAAHPVRLMGIVNATPDSFSDGGRFDDVDRAVAHALRLLDAGADIVDVGGESTRPGAAAVSASEERDRVLPVITGVLAARPGACVSVDTRKASVAAAAVRAGARMVNDVSALGDPAMAAVCAAAPGVEVVLMHMRGQPATMQRDTTYGDLVQEVVDWLGARVEPAVSSGIDRGRLLVDPGVGFGKAPRDNPRLIAATRELGALGLPVLIGASRKRFIGQLTGVEDAAARDAGSIGAALAAVACGAAVLRVHDVAGTRQALTVYQAILGGG
jgi:dihydropteroate synthase